MFSNKLIYGKNNLEKIVSIEINDDSAEIFLENDNEVESIVIKNRFWILSHEKMSKNWIELKGNLYYKYGKQFKNRTSFNQARHFLKNKDVYSVYDPKEALMIKDGYTYYKGLKPKDVSILSFDIETTGLTHDDNSKVLLISNTYRRGNEIVRKLFAYDDYNTTSEMFDAWCNWVFTVNPSILVGHNIFGFDLPYLNFCAKKAGTSLKLGRNESEIRFDTFESKMRKDQTQDLHYKRCHIYGREIIDTMFLAIKHDIAVKKYESYGLKAIIKVEGLEKKDRTFYDASKIRFNYTKPDEWNKIKEYCKDDSDDSLALFDLMSASMFYTTQSIPKSFQAVCYTATGSQINSIMCRAYLQDMHSLPKATESKEFVGAISVGNPGIYTNVFKIDVASLYPSIMIQYEVYDKSKDPKGYFKELINTFTKLRLEYKAKAKENKYYDDLQSAYKIFINSGYGFLGATGLNFNSPSNAAFITSTGRDILSKAIDWAKTNSYVLVNADTDSISICKEDSSDFSSEADKVLETINALFPERIKFEHDGFFKKIIVVKAKNYILWDGKKIKYKGSAIKASTKETALKEFINKIIDSILNDQYNYKEIYDQYVKEILNIKDIKQWVTRKTLSDKVFNAKRTNEQKVLDAIKDSEYVEGDRAYFYFKEDNTLSLAEKFDGNYSREKLYEKLYKTALVFKTIIPKETFINYKLKKNKELLHGVS